MGEKHWPTRPCLLPLSLPCLLLAARVLGPASFPSPASASYNASCKKGVNFGLSKICFGARAFALPRRRLRSRFLGYACSNLSQESPLVQNNDTPFQNPRKHPITPNRFQLGSYASIHVRIKRIFWKSSCNKNQFNLQVRNAGRNMASAELDMDVTQQTSNLSVWTESGRQCKNKMHVKPSQVMPRLKPQYSTYYYTNTSWNGQKIWCATKSICMSVFLTGFDGFCCHWSNSKRAEDAKCDQFRHGVSRVYALLCESLSVGVWWVEVFSQDCVCWQPDISFKLKSTGNAKNIFLISERHRIDISSGSKIVC